MQRSTLTIVILGTLLFAGVAIADVIDPTNPYAWGENIGWLNWGTAEGDVFVPDSATDGELTGYVWGENVGWISLNCSNTSSCGTVDYKVERDQGNISGYAWGENVGWISFSCNNSDSCAGGATLPNVDFGVSIATVSGEFSGYAWGENIGWVVMNCLETASCGTVDYKVQTSVTPEPAGAGVGGGGCPGPSVLGYASACWCNANPTDPLCTTTAAPTQTPDTGTVAPPAPQETPVGQPEPSVLPPEQPPPTVGPPGPPQPEPRPIGGIGERIDGLLDFIRSDWVRIGALVTILMGIVPMLLAFLQATNIGAIGALLASFLNAIGLRKKARVWGVVYDANSKHPLGYARMQLLDESNRVLETRFADRDGRYGFLLSTPGTQEGAVLRVHVTATKQGYAFPSQRVGKGIDFVVYEHPYHGEVIEVRSDTTFAHDVPMDPVAATKRPVFPPWLALIGGGTESLLNLGFFAGLILVPWNLIRHPSTLNIVIAVIFVLANVVRALSVYRPYGRIKEVTTGELLPFALVTLHNEDGARRTFAVSDERGRYFLSTGEGPGGLATLKVQTPANYSPSRTITHDISGDRRIRKRGWVTKDVTV